MNVSQPYYLLAAEAYGTGTYDCGNFDEGCATTSTGTNTGTDTGAAANGGGLSYTGYNIIIPVAIGAALIIAAVILLVTRFTRRRKAPTA